MKAIYLLAYELLNIYYYVVIVNVIISWLVGFNVLNTQNNLSTIYKNEQNIFAKAVRRNTKPFRSV